VGQCGGRVVHAPCQLHAASFTGLLATPGVAHVTLTDTGRPQRRRTALTSTATKPSSQGRSVRSPPDETRRIKDERNQGMSDDLLAGPKRMLRACVLVTAALASGILVSGAGANSLLSRQPPVAQHPADSGIAARDAPAAGTAGCWAPAPETRMPLARAAVTSTQARSMRFGPASRSSDITLIPLILDSSRLVRGDRTDRPLRAWLSCR